MIEIKEAIEYLAKKAKSGVPANDALHYSQAALNLAHVAAVQHSLPHQPYQGAAQNTQQ